MHLYDLNKMNRQVSAAFSLQALIVTAHSVGLHYLGVPFLWCVLWSLLAMMGLTVQRGFYEAVGGAKATMENWEELKKADVPFTVISGEAP